MKWILIWWFRGFNVEESDLFKFHEIITCSPSQMLIWFIPLQVTQNLTFCMEFSFPSRHGLPQKWNCWLECGIIQMSHRHDECLHSACWFDGEKTMQLTTNAHVHTRIFAFIENICEREKKSATPSQPKYNTYILTCAIFFIYSNNVMFPPVFFPLHTHHVAPTARVGMCVAPPLSGLPFTTMSINFHI